MKKRIAMFSAQNNELVMTAGAIAFMSVGTWLHSVFGSAAMLAGIWLVAVAFGYADAWFLRLRKVAGIYGGPHAGIFADLMRRSGIGEVRILEYDPTFPQARAIGFGKAKAVVIAREILEYPPEQVAAVFAHELGHHANRDPFTAVLGGATAGTLVIWLSNALVPSAAAAALLVSPMLTVAVALTGTAYSRRIERRADRYAAKLTGQPNDLSKALANLKAGWEARGVNRDRHSFLMRLLSLHPPLQQRINKYALK